MTEESRAFADPVTRSLMAPVRTGPGYREALDRIRELGTTAADAFAGAESFGRVLRGETTDDES